MWVFFWGWLVLAVGLMRGVSRRGRRRSQGGAAGGGPAIGIEWETQFDPVGIARPIRLSGPSATRRMGMGRTRAEAQRRRGGDRKEREFLQLPWTAGKGYPPLSEKWLDQGMDPTQPHGQVEKVTAPSAGGFPNPVGKDRWRNKLGVGGGIGIEWRRDGIRT